MLKKAEEKIMTKRLVVLGWYEVLMKVSEAQPRS